MNEDKNRTNRQRDVKQGVTRGKANLTSGKSAGLSTVPEKGLGVNRMKENAAQYLPHITDDTNLRECVLNRLWDSLPPEAQISSYSNHEDSESDATESGLDQADDEDDDGSFVGSPDIQFSEQTQLPDQPVRSEESERMKTTSVWEVNFDFIQAIIWLKSITSTLQCVPVDEFRKAFRNQWEFSQKTRSNDGLVEAELLGNRLAANLIFEKNHKDIVIPETDESNTPSQSSVTSQPHETVVMVPVSADMNSTVDSGFNSEKPDCTELMNSSETMENPYATKSGASLSLKVNLVEQLQFHRSQRFLAGGTADKEDIVRKMDRKRRQNMRSKRNNPKQPRLSVSSATLSYILRSTECNQLLIRSVRAILGVLENERSGGSFRNWNISVQKEAVEAVVSIVRQLEKERGSDICRKEVVLMVRKVVENMLHSDELDKSMNWEHHRLVVLELCSTVEICREIIGYLISEIARLIPVAAQTSERNVRDSLELLEKSHILFHSLEVVLRKYRMVAPSFAEAEKENVSQKIPEVSELWRRHWRFDKKHTDIFSEGQDQVVPESSQDRQEAWATVLQELAVASTRNWPQVKVLAWRCLVVLKA